jgi:hypothetical protein
MGISKSRLVAEAYEKRQVEFQDRHEILLRIFHGTPITKPMEELIQSVAQAALLNRDAGWLPREADTFSAREYFEATIKRDQQGDFVCTLADVPEDLQPEYAGWDEPRFQRYLAALRETCRRASGEMENLRSEIKLLHWDGGTFFDGLSDLVDEDSADEEDMRFKSLFGNLQAEWIRYTELGFSLIQMADALPELRRPAQNAGWRHCVHMEAELKTGVTQC